MKNFAYFRPKTVSESLELLKQTPGAMVLAGGTNLIVNIKEASAAPQALVDIGRLEELAEIQLSPQKGGVIGATATMGRVVRACRQAGAYSALLSAAAHLGSALIRNRATLGGNLANASPAADTAAPLLVCDTRVVLRSSRGERTLPLDAFFLGPGQPDLKPDELLTAVKIPAPPVLCGESYQKLGVRKALQIAIVGVAARISADPESGVIEKAALALSSVAPIPLLVEEAGALLDGRKPTASLFEEAAQLAMDAAKPISDLRASAEYRREMVAELTRRALTEAWREATHKSQGRLEAMP